MANYPFNLKGSQGNYRGSGRKDGETQKSPEFTLKQGVLIAEIEHYGLDDFKLEIVPTEGISRGQAIATSLGGSFATGAATGATIGSVIPVAGTIMGGLIGGAAGWIAGKAISSAIAPSIYTVEQKRPLSGYDITLVNNDDRAHLRPGKYRLEVKSESGWSCNFIQPALGQSVCALTDENDDDSDLGAGHHIFGPFTSGSKPILANIRHKGGGEFFFGASSVDGLHQCTLFAQQGQFHFEDIQTEFKPGKEYILAVKADGEWYMDFTEGY